MTDVYKFLRTFMGMLTDAASLGWEYLIEYKDYLWRLTKRFALFAAIPIPVLLVCLIFEWDVNWLYSAYCIFVGAEAVILMVLAFPIIVSAQIISDMFPKFAGSIQKSAQRIAAVAFWTLMLAVYFYVVPVWENPRMIPVVLIAAAALALGSYAGWVSLPRNLVKIIATLFLVGIFVIATFAFSFPNRTRQFVGLIHTIDEAEAKPKQVKVESADQIRFVNATTGEPQLWYYRSPTGEYELYDQEGFHASGARLKVAKTTEERNQIIAWFRHEAQRKEEVMQTADEQQRKVEQQLAQEQALQKREMFKSTYLRDRSFLLVNHPATNQAAVVIVEDNMINQPLGKSVASIFDAKGLKTTTTLFTDRFVKDGLFEKLFVGGDAGEIDALELAPNVNLLILGKRMTSLTTNADLQNIITAKVTLDAKTISIKSDQAADSFTVSETGVGFSKDAAVTAAMDKILNRWRDTLQVENRP